MSKSDFITCLLVVVTCLVSPVWSSSLRQNQTWPRRTYPGQLGFPTLADLLYLGEQLDGDLITPYDSEYLNTSLTQNLRNRRLPAVIAKPKTIEDIQRLILFARKYNLHLTIFSSGHDGTGRATHDGSLNLNMNFLNEINVNVNSQRNSAGEAKIQAGATLLEVFTEVDKVQGPDETGTKLIGRVIVGGGSNTVTVGGYTQGGGHSSIGRKFGLAVDNLLEATIVTSDAKVHVLNISTTVTYDLDGSVSVSNDTSLFWAIRGGGGGTWGVVVDFTFKIHYAPERFRVIFALMYTQDVLGNPINQQDLGFVWQQINNLSPDWGGYFYSGPGSFLLAPGAQGQGYIFVSLIHQGSNCSASNREVDQLLLNPNWSIISERYDSPYLQFQERQVSDPTPSAAYTFSSFIQRNTFLSITTTSEFVDAIIELQKANILCTGTLIGGNIANVPPDSTPIHPGFRSGLISLPCVVNLPPGDGSNETIERVLAFVRIFDRFGVGSYFNEAAEDIPDWKLRFWGSRRTYERLLNIKERVDPNNYMWCHNCVGSDLGYNYRRPDSEGLPGQPETSYFQTSVEFDQI